MVREAITSDTPNIQTLIQMVPGFCPHQSGRNKMYDHCGHYSANARLKGA